MNKKNVDEDEVFVLRPRLLILIFLGLMPLLAVAIYLNGNNFVEILIFLAFFITYMYVIYFLSWLKIRDGILQFSGIMMGRDYGSFIGMLGNLNVFNSNTLYPKNVLMALNLKMEIRNIGLISNKSPLGHNFRIWRHLYFQDSRNAKDVFCVNIFHFSNKDVKAFIEEVKRQNPKVIVDID